MSIESTVIADLAAPAPEAARREFLTCRLGAETYGIDILKVQEIREIDRVTRVPKVARHVRGVLNLRGEIVPIVDLGLMFGFPQPLVLSEGSAIVLRVDDRLIGLAVSSVSDVIGLADDEMLPPPELGDRAIASVISGIGTRDGASLLLLDVDQIVKRVREERE